ncbi:MAG: N-acetylmuramoyl-L-alanine amidase, partial [Deltaproteobacteria bacterium]|nr:N-acetylmuramoyl-L-alanine amidase [Deltaproteobacteria bacterium]
MAIVAVVGVVLAHAGSPPSVADALAGAGARVDRVERVAGGTNIYVTFPASSSRDLAAHDTNAIADAAAREGRASRGFVRIFARFGDSAAYVPIGRAFDAPPPPPKKPFEAPREKSGPPGYGQPSPAGFLSGKSVFLSPGHGWYLNGSSWLTQRGNTNGLVEDFSNAEAVLQFLVPYFHNAGALVVTMRERDLNTNMSIVDNADPSVTLTGTWTTSTSTPGYYGSNYLAKAVAGSATATATFPAAIAEDGLYTVSVWYTGGSNRSTDARITVRHADGDSVFTHNMQRDGFTWRYLGRYYFRADDPVSRRSVVFTNQGSDTSKFVIVDAVRFGGGMDEDAGKPRWEMSGLYHAPFMGCDTCATSTVTTMPRYAAWENESWEDGVYISWHTNAPNPGTGTESYTYASGGYDAPFDGVAGSTALRDRIHAEMVADIRAGWDAGWTDRGKHTNWYGEINPSYNAETPGALFEIAFHDTASDAADLAEPEFRKLVARAVYQGAVRYFAVRDGVTPKFLPEPPESLAVTYDGADIVASWTAPPADGGGLAGDAATGYRFYLGTSGKGFGDALVVTQVAAAAAPPPRDGTLYYARASATNDGGESFPTETLAVSTGTGSRVLVVNGFDRIDSTMNVPESYYGGGTIDRGYLDRMNAYDYVIAHADALFAAGLEIDSASNEAVADGDVDLFDYPAVVWIAGEESFGDDTFDPDEQLLVADYLDAGGRLFVSGSEIGWDLWALGDSADREFFTDYLRAVYTNDSSGTGAVSASGIFAGIAPFAFDFDDYTIYAADWPDCVKAVGGGSTDMAYVGGTCSSGGGAAVVDDTGVFRIVYLGFPFETIYSITARRQVMSAAMDFLLESTTTSTTTTSTTTSTTIATTTSTTTSTTIATTTTTVATTTSSTGGSTTSSTATTTSSAGSTT